MPEPLRGLTDSDVTVLREVISWAKQQGLNARGRFPRERTYAEGDDQMAPEVYIAKTPAGGIDAITSGDTGTGTGGYDEPGSAECDLYVIDETDAVPDLRAMSKDLTVYNVSEVAVGGGIYVPVMRDKWGRWLTVTPPGATLVAFQCNQATHPGRGVRFDILIGSEDGDGWAYSGAAEAIDWRTVDSDLYPGQDATGLGFYRSDGLLEVVAYDCDEPSGTGT